MFTSTSFLIGLAVAIAAMTTITVAVLTAVFVRKKVKERLAANNQHKVVFADMRETVDSYIREHADQHMEFSMDQLEAMCQNAPYVIADCDVRTGKIMNFTGIKTGCVDSKLERAVKERGGVVVFDS